MTWSYSTGDLTSMGLDAVRFFVGDTDINYPQLQNEEIEFALQIRGNAYGASAMCAQALSAKYARVVSMSVDGASFQNAQKSAAYASLAREYEIKEAIHYAPPYAGALSKADMRAILANPDRIPDIFRFGMFDNYPNDGVDPPTADGGGYNGGGPGDGNSP